MCAKALFWIGLGLCAFLRLVLGCSPLDKQSVIAGIMIPAKDC